MAKKHQILVIGHDEAGCTPAHEKMAYDTGNEIGRASCRERV